MGNHYDPREERFLTPFGMTKMSGDGFANDCSSDVGCGAWDADGLGRRRAGQNDPKDDVDKEAGAGEKDRQEPENADQRGIEIKIFG